mmetsp:Transcript_15974/g.24889  ORF Transcript_15974/g.24889 Transcript_15974/m.24889 type:complete len:241 (-) Transcript_15974:377-1099(-)|eukprot:CAMPEP_0196824652 /NCGR_PEP_ID=MMETSP1362-20130617/92607_1 /TAXON_ID=163516 /ORGANISM="Leptocylindrus danicus, Strain CCMP1856" /LENGTH=240 /DNA_ID=CAMNT_0042204975 /DNA_START=3 /DNA_END=725 /DNA_ORIENTATION=-
MSTNNTTTASLSKDLLYAPLKSRLQQQTASSTKKRKRKSIEVEQQELVTFLQDASSATKPGSKLQKSVIENKLFQRALTLVGGGIGNGFGAESSGKVGRKIGRLLPVSNRKRRKAGVFLYNPKDGICDVSKLGPLIKLWSKYATDLLQGCKSVAEASRRLSNDAELSGAMVKVLRCNSCASFVGLEGVMVQTTANTWRIAQVRKAPIGKVRTVPKVGTEVGFQIDLTGDQMKQTVCTVEY